MNGLNWMLRTIRVTDSNGTRMDNNDLKLGDSEKELTAALNTSKVVPW